MNCRATTDYAKAGATMRGVAGELVFVVEGVELPGGLRIVGRQIKTGSRTLDFALETPTGKRALLEVKAWNARRWLARARRQRR